MKTEGKMDNIPSNKTVTVWFDLKNEEMLLKDPIFKPKIGPFLDFRWTNNYLYGFLNNHVNFLHKF